MFSVLKHVNSVLADVVLIDRFRRLDDAMEYCRYAQLSTPHYCFVEDQLGNVIGDSKGFYPTPESILGAA